MKKAKTQTGLVREEPAGKESRIVQKPKKSSNKKAAKQRKAAKLKDKKETKELIISLVVNFLKNKNI